MLSLVILKKNVPANEGQKQDVQRNVLIKCACSRTLLQPASNKDLVFSSFEVNKSPNQPNETLCYTVSLHSLQAWANPSVHMTIVQEGKEDKWKNSGNNFCQSQHSFPHCCCAFSALLGWCWWDCLNIKRFCNHFLSYRNDSCLEVLQTVILKIVDTLNTRLCMSVLEQEIIV